MSDIVPNCARCSTPLTPRQIYDRGRHCSLRCAAQTRVQRIGMPIHTSVQLPTMLAILQSNTHSWMTASDLAIWIYGDDTFWDCHAVQSTLMRLRQAGHTIRSRPAPWASQSFACPKAYRLVAAVSEVAA